MPKKGSATIFKNIAKKLKKDKANVLYIVDHLQEKSLTVFSNFLKKYAQFTNKKLVALTYKKRKIFK